MYPYHPGKALNPFALPAPKTSPCDCADHGCPAHPGRDCDTRMPFRKLVRVYRADMDATLHFCEPCAEDAIASGIFSY